MATSFAAYASQYLGRQQNAESAMSSSSQPMFFSFTTNNGSHHGGGHDTDLDDYDDPHLNESEMSAKMPEHDDDDDDDPYLRLDEDEQGHGQRAQQAMPLIARSQSPESPQGWLAHLAHSPRRSVSPAPSSSSSSSDSSPPADLLVAKKSAPPQGSNPPPPPRTAHSLSLTESLLPRDGFSRPLDVFSLPDPRHTPRKRRKHHDATWISVWLGLVSLCVFFSILLLFITKRPKKFPSALLPYTVLLHTVPMLVILTFLSAAAAYVHVYLLRIFVKPVMIATSVFIPATLFISAVWAFVGSFMWDGDTVPTWGETVGLRLFAIIPLVLSIITARRLLHLPRAIHTTSSTLTLATHLLISNPFLLALSPAILLIMFLGSIPFATLIFRLLLIGHPTKSGLEWHVQAWANWAIVGAVCIWLWSWAVARGVLRMTAASVIGAWYFADPSAPIPPPTSTHTIHAALVRASGPSLGSIILAGLILTALRLLSLTALLMRRLPPLLLRIPWVPMSVPIALYVVPGVHWSVRWMEEKSGRLSRYALVYAGLTGAGFWESAIRGRELVGVEGKGAVEPQAPAGRRTRSVQPVPSPNLRKKNFGSEPPLALLTISPLTLSFPFALITYLFVAHTLGAPHEALGAALLAGGVTALVGLFCVGLVKDTADTLYLCYCIDKAAGEKRREEVFVAFEYGFAGSNPGNVGNTTPGRPRGRHPRQPETIVPRPAAQGRETLFDADDDIRSQQQQQQQHRGHGQKTALLVSPFSDERIRTPTATGGSLRRLPVHEDEDDEEGEGEGEEDLDPFRRSVIDDEEAQIQPQARRTPVVGTFGSPTSPGILAAAAAGAPGRPGLTRGPGPTTQQFMPPAAGPGTLPLALPGQKRMLTSTQELNMKSQFLMNMRPYGVDSQGSQGSETMEMQASGASSGAGGVSGLKSQASLRASGLGSGSGPGSRSASASAMQRVQQARAVSAPPPAPDGEDSLSEGEGEGEGEESQLGPGSDFFR